MDINIKKLFQGRKGVLATMHKKEQVITPLVERELGLILTLPENFDTDMFGSFTNEVERAGDQLQAAKVKVEKAMEETGLNIGISSEGSFGPHPLFPHIPFNRELVLFVDKEQELEITGYTANSNTNFAQKEVSSIEEAKDFISTAGFPEHGFIVKANAETITKSEIVKGITSVDELKTAISTLTKNSKRSFTANRIFKKNRKPFFIETDMRAMYNPTRMKNIELAVVDLIRKINSVCPTCFAPGFEIKEYKKGLKCAGCRFPTDSVISHLYVCKKCKHTEKIMYPNGHEYEDPSKCYICNP